MKRLLVVSLLFITTIANSQDLVATATKFLNTLDTVQKRRVLYPFDDAEKYNWHFFPKDDRKGVMWNELTPVQRTAAMHLVHQCLGAQGAKEAAEIMQLEMVLKAMENRKADDHHRDSGKYYFTVFGVPAADTRWGWRLEGHHLSFTFSADKGKLISGTPGFMGANPAIVPSGPHAGEQVLKREADAGFTLLHALSATQLKQTLVDTTAPNEIITFVSRNVMIEHPAGIRYNALTAAQQQQLLQLIGVYVHRYTKLFSDDLLKEIQDAGLENLRFAWAGATQPQIGKPHYYRIQGPTFIIEYDNSQNNANHVHSVFRDLQHDFGDPLLEHYNASH